MIGFDRNGRPVKTVGFDYEALDDNSDAENVRLETRLAVSEWLRVRLEWIARARTTQSQQIRYAIVQAEIDGTSLTAIAKRLGVSRQAVHEQAKRRSQS